jgi:hypothetical protein
MQLARAPLTPDPSIDAQNEVPDAATQVRRVIPSPPESAIRAPPPSTEGACGITRSSLATRAVSAALLHESQTRTTVSVSGDFGGKDCRVNSPTVADDGAANCEVAL